MSAIVEVPARHNHLLSSLAAMRAGDWKLVRVVRPIATNPATCCRPTRNGTGFASGAATAPSFFRVLVHHVLFLRSPDRMDETYKAVRRGAVILTGVTADWILQIWRRWSLSLSQLSVSLILACAPGLPAPHALPTAEMLHHRGNAGCGRFFSHLAPLVNRY